MHVAEEEEDISFFRPSVPLRVNHSAEKKKATKLLTLLYGPSPTYTFFLLNFPQNVVNRQMSVTSCRSRVCKGFFFSVQASTMAGFLALVCDTELDM